MHKNEPQVNLAQTREQEVWKGMWGVGEGRNEKCREKEKTKKGMQEDDAFQEAIM